MRGKKGYEHADPRDPPRGRANNRRGRGTYANDRPPIVGTVGRESRQVRLRVVLDKTAETLEEQVHRFTRVHASVYTDELPSHNHIIHQHATVAHGAYEYARDDDGDGVREIHCNTAEGLWTAVRNFLRPFKGAHKKYLAGYVAICEFQRNLKRISPAFIAALVTFQTFWGCANTNGKSDAWP
jgi:transposase-like protein